MYRKQVRRRRAILTLLVLSSFLLLTITYGQSGGGVQRGVGTIFGPVQEVADRALKPARDLVGWFDQTFEARGENGRLREELERARQQAIAGKVALRENAQLRKLVALDRGPVAAAGAYEPVTGRVIARSPLIWNSSVTIDLGKGDGVAVDDPVLSGDGLVGRVSAVHGGSSQVTLLTDHASAVSAKVLPSGAQGLVRAEVGDSEDLILDFIDAAGKIGSGQAVVTAGWQARGFSSLFPANLPIGEVTRAPIREQEASQQVHLRPYADLANLEIVQVLTGGGEG